MKPALQARGLSFAYHGKDPILKDLDLEVREGQVLALVGLSGCGKSTLVHCLSGIIPHVYQGEFLSGDVLCEGTPITEMKLPVIATKLGIVFQNPETQLFFSNVEDELAFGPENLGLPRIEIANRIDETLGLLEIEHLRTANPRQLSGGQKQLVALAAVLTLKPNILLFDETMSQIDRKGKTLIKQMIIRLKESGKSILMIEHDLENLDVADTVKRLKDGGLEQFNGSLL